MFRLVEYFNYIHDSSIGDMCDLGECSRSYKMVLNQFDGKNKNCRIIFILLNVGFYLLNTIYSKVKNHISQF